MKDSATVDRNRDTETKNRKYTDGWARRKDESAIGCIVFGKLDSDNHVGISMIRFRFPRRRICSGWLMIKRRVCFTWRRRIRLWGILQANMT